VWTPEVFPDYELLDAGGFNRLERWGKHILIRPDPQALWPGQGHPLWEKADAVYNRSEKGGGEWSKNSLPASWSLSWRDLIFKVRPTGFKHTGIFPEQAANWAVMQQLIRESKKTGQFSVLNLFAYTGAATVSCAKAGALVTHVDAAKGIVSWAKENADLSGIEARWIVDDCTAFVAKELRRGKTYDGIILDPPSYGRGPGGQIWKIEDCLYTLLSQTVQLLSPDAKFLFINSYTTGLAPSVLRYLLEILVSPRFGGRAEARELGLPVTQTGLFLPCGATGRWIQS